MYVSFEIINFIDFNYWSLLKDSIFLSYKDKIESASKIDDISVTALRIFFFVSKSTCLSCVGFKTTDVIDKKPSLSKRVILPDFSKFQGQIECVTIGDTVAKHRI